MYLLEGKSRPVLQVQIEKNFILTVYCRSSLPSLLSTVLYTYTVLVTCEKLPSLLTIWEKSTCNYMGKYLCTHGEGKGHLYVYGYSRICSF